MAMIKVICKQCGKQENKQATMDGICASCWNKKPRFFDVNKYNRKGELK